MWFLRKSLHDDIDFNQTDLTFRRTHERSGSRPTFYKLPQHWGRWPGNGWNWEVGGSATGGNNGGIKGYRMWKKEYW